MDESTRQRLLCECFLPYVKEVYHNCPGLFDGRQGVILYLHHDSSQCFSIVRNTFSYPQAKITQLILESLEVEVDAGLEGLELLHDLGEGSVRLQDEALVAEDREVEPGALVERDAEELAGHVGGQVLLRPARAVPRHRAVEDDGGLPAAVLGAAEGLRAAAGLRQDLGVERHPRVRVPVHQPLGGGHGGESVERRRRGATAVS